MAIAALLNLTLFRPNDRCMKLAKKAALEIAAAGGIEPVVALAASGTDAQKEQAAGALNNLAAKNAGNKKAIAAAGSATSPLTGAGRDQEGFTQTWYV